MTDTRLRGSLPLKILIFFSRSPDELLTIHDVADKWGVTYAAAQAATYRLCQAGWIVRSADSAGRSSMYEVGPQLREEIVR